MNPKFYFRKLLLCLPFFAFDTYGVDCVILLHGLARSDASMSKLEETLSDEGYNVVNSGYPSRKYDIGALAKTRAMDKQIRKIYLSARLIITILKRV